MSARSLLVKRLPCVCCEIEGVIQPLPTEAHHLNLGGNAGQKRLGDDHQVAICKWHHRALRKPGMSSDEMTKLYGPSLALDSRQFKFAYGGDQNLRSLTNAKLATQEPAIA